MSRPGSWLSPGSALFVSGRLIRVSEYDERLSVTATLSRGFLDGPCGNLTREITPRVRPGQDDNPLTGNSVVSFLLCGLLEILINRAIRKHTM